MTRLGRSILIRSALWLGLLGWVALSALPAHGLVLCHSSNGHSAIEVAHGSGDHECLARPAGCCGHDEPARTDGRREVPQDSTACPVDHGCVDEPIDSEMTMPARVTAAPQLLPSAIQPIADDILRPLLRDTPRPDESPPGDPAVTRCCIVLLI